MHIDFKTPKVDPAKSINIVKRALRRMPEAQRMLIANQMWNGTDVKHLPTAMIPFRRAIEDANAHAIGKAWKDIEDKTIKYLDRLMTPHEEEEYFRKLLTVTYKQEPEKKKFIVHHIESKEKDFVEFKKEILDDIQTCRDKEFKEHLLFWVGKEV